MDWTTEDVGNTCPCCERSVVIAHEQPGYVLVSCSEFCATCSEEESELWKNRKVGEYVVGPCKSCGCPIEDVYGESSWQCCDCHREEKQQRREDLLTECCVLLSTKRDKMALDLAKRIAEELK